MGVDPGLPLLRDPGDVRRLESGGDRSLDQVACDAVVLEPGDALAQLFEALVEEVLVAGLAHPEMVGDEIDDALDVVLVALVARRLDGVVEGAQDLHVAVGELGHAGEEDIQRDPLDGVLHLACVTQGEGEELVDVGQLENLGWRPRRLQLSAGRREDRGQGPHHPGRALAVHSA